MNDEESKIETEVAKFVSIPSSPSSADGGDSRDGAKTQRKKKIPGKAAVFLLHDSAPAKTDTSVVEMPGMRHVLMSQEAQTNLHCLVGVHITAEAPWTKVSKPDLMAVLENQGAADCIKDLTKYPKEDVLVGYDPKSDKPGDDSFYFYVAVTEEASLKVEEQLAEERRAYERKLTEAVNRAPRPWTSLGSEAEVDASRAANTRPLIKIEIETKPGDLLKPITLEDRRSDYVSIGPGRTVFKGVPRLRIDADVQAVPPLQSEAVQTDPGLPVNAWSQYVYDLETAQEAAGQTARLELPKDYKFDHAADMEQALLYNETLNLYTNDYPLLVQRPEDATIPVPKTYEPYEAYADVRHCFGKVVPNIAWHPMWSDVVAVPYVREARALSSASSEPDYDRLRQDVTNRNTVLIWTFQDSLQPRLILLSPREVVYVRWCPVNPQVLVGACVSGQVVVWDLQDRLAAVEAKESLTRERQQYRTAIRSLLDWSEPQEAAKYIHATAVSSLEHSHQGPATSLRWLSPFHRIDASGHLNPVKRIFGMQFVSCGEDGALLVWDLHYVPADIAEQKKKQKVEGIKAVEPPQTPSRFTPLDRYMRPIYKITPTDKEVPIITAISIDEEKPLYQREEKKEQEKTHDKSGEDEDEKEEVSYAFPRETYQPIFKPATKKAESMMTACTESGSVLQLSWEGYDYDRGEVVTSEQVDPFSVCSGIHDGAVTCSVVSPFLPSLVLTVGGSVLALWSSSLKDAPILWRTRPARLSAASWSPESPSRFRITRLDGCMELWDLIYRSDHPVLEQSISGEPLTAVGNHVLPLPGGKKILAVGDYWNALKLYFTPQQFATSEPSDLQKMIDFEKNEVLLRLEYKAWNEQYSFEHRKATEQKKEVVIERPTRIQPEEEKQLNKKWNRLLNVDQKALKLLKEEEDSKVAILLKKKNLDKKELMMKQAPLIALKKMDEERKEKQRLKVREQETAFERTLQSMFPDIAERPVEVGPSLQEMQNEAEKALGDIIAEYSALEAEVLESLPQRRFDKNLEWERVMAEGIERRAALDADLFLRDPRHERYKIRKAERLLNPPEPPPALPLERQSKAQSISLLLEQPVEIPTSFPEEEEEGTTADN